MVIWRTSTIVLSLTRSARYLSTRYLILLGKPQYKQVPYYHLARTLTAVLFLTRSARYLSLEYLILLGKHQYKQLPDRHVARTLTAFVIANDIILYQASLWLAPTIEQVIHIISGQKGNRYTISIHTLKGIHLLFMLALTFL